VVEPIGRVLRVVAAGVTAHDVPNRPRLVRLGRCGEALVVRGGAALLFPRPLLVDALEANRRARATALADRLDAPGCRSGNWYVSRRPPRHDPELAKPPRIEEREAGGLNQLTNDSANVTYRATVWNPMSAYIESPIAED
jgi:hypothetical protein